MSGKHKDEKYRSIFLVVITIFMTDILYRPVQLVASSRIAHVMYKGFGGIEDANRKIKFAEVKNIAFDLNLPEISARFGCKTTIGKNFIDFSLQKPISSKDQNHTIKKRQKLFIALQEKSDLLLKLENLIAQAAVHEVAVAEFMAKRFVLNEEEFIKNPFSFLNKYLGQSTFYETISTWWSITNLYHGGKKIGKEGLNDMQVSYENGINYAKSFEGKPVLTLENAQKLFMNTLNSTPAFMLSTAIWIANVGDTAEISATNLARAYSLAFSAYALYTKYYDAIEKRNALYALSQLINIAQDIEDLCFENDIEHQFKVSAIRSRLGQQLLEELAHERYQAKESSVFFTPAVLTFIYKIYEHDTYLAPVYASIAEMDAYVAIAKKMIELQHGPYRYCFSQFVDDVQPTIYAKDFWNVLVSSGNVVVNDLFEHRNIILTGSNEGGKTTAIRAILQNIVLAQTFGIAAASEFKLTQFDVIYSFLNVSDDILTGKSRFASELKQAQDILRRMQALKSDEKFFFAFDELFTGTNGEDGAQCAYQFINNIANYKGIQFIYATHFNLLKTIGAHNSACANYKIEPPLRNKSGKFIRDDKGQLIYPYKLSPGANDVNVAMDRARDAGIFA